MAKATEESIKNQLKQDAPSPVYLLYGEEQYLVSHYADLIPQTLVGNCMPDFNLSRMAGENACLSQIIAAAEALPVMHSHRCVLVQDFSPTDETDKALAEWESYLADPCPGNVVVFYYTTLQPGNSIPWKAFLKSCETHGDVIKFTKKTEQDLVKLLCNGAAKRNCRMTAGTAAYLIECVGADMNTLLNELDKLCTYKLNQQVEDRDIDLLCAKTLSATAFQMVREINRRNTNGTLQILHRLFSMREDPIKIMGALASTYVNMYRAVTAEEARIPLAEFGEQLHMKNTKGLSYSLKDAHALGVKKLDVCLQLLADCDKAMKSQPVDSKILFEQTVIALLRVSGAKYD